MSFVVDASVAAKWLVREADSDKAEALLMQWKQGDIDLLAPEIVLAEIGSMMWKKSLRGLVPPDAALEAYEKFVRVSLPLAPIHDLAGPALKLALQYRHSVYDGLYVALAQVTGWTLITADEKLCDVLLPGFTQVRLLRDWS
jgi:predicted nucleic acid-binding protein